MQSYNNISESPAVIHFLIQFELILPKYKFLVFAPHKQVIYAVRGQANTFSLPFELKVRKDLVENKISRIYTGEND